MRIVNTFFSSSLSNYIHEKRMQSACVLEGKRERENREQMKKEKKIGQPKKMMMNMTRKPKKNEEEEKY